MASFLLFRRSLVTLAAGLMAAGCSSTDERSAAKKSGIGPPQAWETMTHAAKKTYMQTVVLPEMKKVFMAWDPDSFADFSCETCHGLDAVETKFSMPNPDLFGLYPTGHPEQKRLVKEEREILTFMFSKVVPKMQALLGADTYDPVTKKGFSCFSCHPAGE